MSGLITPNSLKPFNLVEIWWITLLPIYGDGWVRAPDFRKEQARCRQWNMSTRYGQS